MVRGSNHRVPYARLFEPRTREPYARSCERAEDEKYELPHGIYSRHPRGVLTANDGRRPDRQTANDGQTNRIFGSWEKDSRSNFTYQNVCRTYTTLITSMRPNIPRVCRAYTLSLKVISEQTYQECVDAYMTCLMSLVHTYWRRVEFYMLHVLQSSQSCFILIAF
jgi:hypothetical protein